MSDLQNLKEWEAHIHAFTSLAAHRQGTGPLAGISVGVKDIIDVAGLATCNGSQTCIDAAPARHDADVVGALRQAGASIIGKTTTTEFAFTDPTACRNPHDIRRSPGGSSSGSGAAVGAGVVDLALGTQTAGSLCRPAAYCGGVGFKPSFGAVSTRGVTPLAPSFDTVGLIASSVHVAHTGFSAIATAETRAKRRNIVSMLPTDVLPSRATQAAFDAAARALDAVPRRFEADCARIVANHRLVMNHEAAVAHSALLEPGQIDLLQPKFRAGLLAGAATSKSQADKARAELTSAAQAFWAQMADVDIILTLPVPDGAPLIDGTTGFQDWLTPWTVFGGPLISLPWGLDEIARPRAVMLAAAPGRDFAILDLAAELEKMAPALPKPRLPRRP